MKRPQPRISLLPLQAIMILLLSITLPGIGPLIAGAMSTTPNRMNIFGNITFVASALLGLRWLNDEQFSKIVDGSIALQVYFHTFAGAFFMCFGVFLGSVAGSIAVDRYIHKSNTDHKVTFLFFLLMLFLMRAGFELGLSEADYAASLVSDIAKVSDQ
jgi:hypothetical protein